MANQGNAETGFRQFKIAPRPPTITSVPRTVVQYAPGLSLLPVNTTTGVSLFGIGQTQAPVVIPAQNAGLLLTKTGFTRVTNSNTNYTNPNPPAANITKRSGSTESVATYVAADLKTPSTLGPPSSSQPLAAIPVSSLKIPSAVTSTGGLSIDADSFSPMSNTNVPMAASSGVSSDADGKLAGTPISSGRHGVLGRPSILRKLKDTEPTNYQGYVTPQGTDSGFTYWSDTSGKAITPIRNDFSAANEDLNLLPVLEVPQPPMASGSKTLDPNNPDDELESKVAPSVYIDIAMDYTSPAATDAQESFEKPLDLPGLELPAQPVKSFIDEQLEKKKGKGHVEVKKRRPGRPRKHPPQTLKTTEEQPSLDKPKRTRRSKVSKEEEERVRKFQEEQKLMEKELREQRMMLRRLRSEEEDNDVRAEMERAHEKLRKRRISSEQEADSDDTDYTPSSTESDTWRSGQSKSKATSQSASKRKRTASGSSSKRSTSPQSGKSDAKQTSEKSDTPLSTKLIGKTKLPLGKKIKVLSVRMEDTLKNKGQVNLSKHLKKTVAKSVTKVEPAIKRDLTEELVKKSAQSKLATRGDISLPCLKERLVEKLNKSTRPSTVNICAQDNQSDCKRWLHIILKDVLGQSLFQCPMCPYEQETSRKVKDHLLVQHQRSMYHAENGPKHSLFYFCRHCDFVSQQQLALWHHFQWHHKITGVMGEDALDDLPAFGLDLPKPTIRELIIAKEAYRCPFCRRVSLNKTRLVLHIRKMHDDQVETPRAYVNYLQMEHSNRIDQDMLNSVDTVADHMREKEQFTCLHCYFTGHSQEEIEVHCIRRHGTRLLLFSCFQCPEFRSFTSQMVTTHVKNDHSPGVAQQCLVTVIGENEKELLHMLSPQGVCASQSSTAVTKTGTVASIKSEGKVSLKATNIPKCEGSSAVARTTKPKNLSSDKLPLKSSTAVTSTVVKAEVKLETNRQASPVVILDSDEEEDKKPDISKTIVAASQADDKDAGTVNASKEPDIGPDNTAMVAGPTSLQPPKVEKISIGKTGTQIIRAYEMETEEDNAFLMEVSDDWDGGKKRPSRLRRGTNPPSANQGTRTLAASTGVGPSQRAVFNDTVERVIRAGLQATGMGKDNETGAQSNDAQGDAANKLVKESPRKDSSKVKQVLEILSDSEGEVEVVGVENVAMRPSSRVRAAIAGKKQATLAQTSTPIRRNVEILNEPMVPYRPRSRMMGKKPAVNVIEDAILIDEDSDDEQKSSVSDTTATSQQTLSAAQTVSKLITNKPMYTHGQDLSNLVVPQKAGGDQMNPTVVSVDASKMGVTSTSVAPVQVFNTGGNQSTMAQTTSMTLNPGQNNGGPVSIVVLQMPQPIVLSQNQQNITVSSNSNSAAASTVTVQNTVQVDTPCTTASQPANQSMAVHADDSQENPASTLLKDMVQQAQTQADKANVLNVASASAESNISIQASPSTTTAYATESGHASFLDPCTGEQSSEDLASERGSSQSPDSVKDDMTTHTRRSQSKAQSKAWAVRQSTTPQKPRATTFSSAFASFLSKSDNGD